MAYLAFQENIGDQPTALPPSMSASLAPSTGSVMRDVSGPITDIGTTLSASTPRLSALEWSVVALAERDRLSTLRVPGRMAVAMRILFGDSPNPQLADPRLEALRRIAVLSWHHGYTIPSFEVSAFLAAGFSNDLYELVVDSISRGRARASARRFER
ncbi:MAG: hypothetical protein OSB00_10265 [Sphingomonas bacterium]|nr:hypothetical protein [Sphingomonas bacterium]